MKRNRIFGAPGTGKTAWIINKIVKLAKEGVPLDKIICVSFSNAAIDTMIERISPIMMKENIPEDYRYFRTIHSLCYKFLDTPQDVFEFKRYKNYFKDWKKENIEKYITIMRIESLSLGGMGEDISAEIDQLDISDYEFFKSKFERIKKELRFITFEDMLMKANFKELDADYLFVDEAQDLCPLQWLVIDKIENHIKKVSYICGDDCQCIYGWMGCRVTDFLNREGCENFLLKDTHRLPLKIYESSLRILNEIEIKMEKKLNLLNKDEGEVLVIRKEDIFFEDGKEYLILFRDNFSLNKYACELEELGYVFKKNDECGITVEEVEEVLNGDDCRINMNREKKDYILRAYSREDGPRITLNTIHRAKGKECENVYLFTQLTKKTYMNLYSVYTSPTSRDEELRVLYVAFTRSKKNLFLVEDPYNRYRYQLEYYI